MRAVCISCFHVSACENFERRVCGFDHQYKHDVTDVCTFWHSRLIMYNLLNLVVNSTTVFVTVQGLIVTSKVELPVCRHIQVFSTAIYAAKRLMPRLAALVCSRLILCHFHL